MSGLLALVVRCIVDNLVAYAKRTVDAPKRRSPLWRTESTERSLTDSRVPVLDASSDSVLLEVISRSSQGKC